MLHTIFTIDEILFTRCKKKHASQKHILDLHKITALDTTISYRIYAS